MKSTITCFNNYFGRNEIISDGRAASILQRFSWHPKNLTISIASTNFKDFRSIYLFTIFLGFGYIRVRYVKSQNTPTLNTKLQKQKGSSEQRRAFWFDPDEKKMKKNHGRRLKLNFIIMHAFTIVSIDMSGFFLSLALISIESIHLWLSHAFNSQAPNDLALCFFLLLAAFGCLLFFCVTLINCDAYQ